MVDANRYDEFAALLQQTTRQLLTYLNAVLFRWDDAEDVFQETCLVLWEKFGEFQPGTSFLAWALCVARNKAMSFQARQARRRRFWTPGLQSSLMAAVSNRSSASANADADALSACIDRLCEADRQLVRRCYGEDVPVRSGRRPAWPFTTKRPQFVAAHPSGAAGMHPTGARDRPMNEPFLIPEEFWPLLDALYDGELNPEQWATLESYLAENPDAQLAFVDYVWLRAEVRRWTKSETAQMTFWPGFAVGWAGLAVLGQRHRSIMGQRLKCQPISSARPLRAPRSLPIATARSLSITLQCFRALSGACCVLT